jgi:hypothetical protein
MRLSSSPSFWLGREQCDDANADSAANDHLLTLLFAVDERMGFSEGCGFRCGGARRIAGLLAAIGSADTGIPKQYLFLDAA